MLKSTVIIVTMVRQTLVRAIQSALNENFPVIVIGDGVDVPDWIQNKFKSEDVVFNRTGVRYGCYGAVAGNLAMALAKTEFCTSLGDDDEFIENKGKILLDKIDLNPEIDIWIPNVLFADGKEWYQNKECFLLRQGTPLPTVRTSIIRYCTFSHPPHEKLFHSMDYMMIEKAVNVYNYKVDWIKEPIYKLRGSLKGESGQGNFSQLEFKMV